MDDAFLRDFFKLPPKSAPGLPLRDYFAAYAMNGIVRITDKQMTPDEMAEDAYKIADAMMARRKK